MRSIKDRTGEERIASNGQMMKIIAYRNTWDIDVEFEDGTKVYSKYYRDFKKGKIGNPNCTINKADKEKYIGKCYTNNQGLKLKIKEYKNSTEVLVQFEDGYELVGKLHSIESGSIYYPIQDLYLGQIGESKVGKIKIVKVRNYRDIDVKVLSTGEILKHKNYRDFKNGIITQRHRKTKSEIKDMIGIVRKNKLGEKITIIDYKNTAQITVQNESGEIKNTTLKQFNSGNLFVDTRKQQVQKYINKLSRNGIGLRLKCIDYTNAQHITVLFEDGTVVKNKDISSFKKGEISNPNFQLNKTVLNDWLVQKKAYEHEDGSYEYYCKNVVTGDRDIKNLQELGIKSVF